MLQFQDHLDPWDILRFFEDKVGAGLWRYDAEGRMQWSRGFYRLLGLDPFTIAPSYAEIEKRIHPEDRRPKRDPREFMFDRSLLNGEIRIVRPNGALRWIRIQSEVLLDPASAKESVLGLAIDITEQRRLLQPLKMDSDRYAALIDITGGVLWIGTQDGRITALLKADNNAEAQRLFGNGWIDLLPEEERETALRNWLVAAETGRPYDVEHRLRQPDGSYRWYRCKAVPVPEADGVIREWLGISMDVHQEKLSLQPAGAAKLTGAQLRAARGMLNWSVKQLASRTGLSAAVVRRLEEQNGMLRMPEGTINQLRDTLSAAGVEFIFPAVGKPGVRPR
ncbi:PAS domain-containing protein [Bradyrhizobium sp. USDA 336]|uniref:PAS domain-containing protein n=1 Tax=Bradyrhizobium sp. USDA 336 TaxID=3156311 RepID=UPI00383869BC